MPRRQLWDYWNRISATRVSPRLDTIDIADLPGWKPTNKNELSHSHVGEMRAALSHCFDMYLDNPIHRLSEADRAWPGAESRLRSAQAKRSRTDGLISAERQKSEVEEKAVVLNGCSRERRPRFLPSRTSMPARSLRLCSPSLHLFR
jgi:hypothetical protein